MKKIIIYVLFLVVHVTTAKAQTGLDIMKLNDKHFNFQTEESMMNMEYINSQNKTRSRSLSRLTKHENEKDRYQLIKFLSPADVNGSGFLSLEQNDTQTRYLYLPALKKSRRVSTGEDSDSFMGSDFTYEDLAEMDFEEYSYSLTGSETMQNKDCYKIDIFPKSEHRKKVTGYNKRTYYVSKDHHIVIKVDYYNKHNELYKTLTNYEIKEIENTGLYRPYKMVMHNIKSNHKTVLSFQMYKIDNQISNNTFTVRYLERN